MVLILDSNVNRIEANLVDKPGVEHGLEEVVGQHRILQLVRLSGSTIVIFYIYPVTQKYPHFVDWQRETR